MLGPRHDPHAHPALNRATPRDDARGSPLPLHRHQPHPRAAAADDYAALVARLEKPKQTKPETFRKLFLAMWAQVPNWKSGRSDVDPPARAPLGAAAAREGPAAREASAAARSGDARLAGGAHDRASDAAAQPTRQSIPPPWVPPGAKAEAAPAAEPSPSRRPAADARRDGDGARRGHGDGHADPRHRRLAAARRRSIPSSSSPSSSTASSATSAGGNPLDGQLRHAAPRRARAPARTRGKARAKQRRYAAYQLDRMDRQRPQKAIATAPDDRVRAEIIHAYGEEHALDAVEAILAQVDSPSHRVRREARWAWLRYVTGKAPPPAPSASASCGGGQRRGGREAGLSHLSRDRDAGVAEGAGRR